jgi:hypothetical protein
MGELEMKVGRELNFSHEQGSNSRHQLRYIRWLMLVDAIHLVHDFQNRSSITRIAS